MIELTAKRGLIYRGNVVKAGEKFSVRPEDADKFKFSTPKTILRAEPDDGLLATELPPLDDTPAPKKPKKNHG